MAVSNLVGTITPSTQKIIDYAFRACRLAPQQISGEYIQTAFDLLNMMLQAWANESVPLWCKTKYILPLLQGVITPAVPPGLVDILEANLRQCTEFLGSYTASEGNAAFAFDDNPATACTQSSPNGNITLQLSSAASVQNVGIMPFINGVWSVQLQYSSDGATWTTFYENTDFEAQAGVFLWVDFEGLPTQPFWRLQAMDGTVLNVAELFFGNNAMEIPIARINVDDYWNLPNKTFQGRPVQYWCDRQLSGPLMRLWPAPGAAFVFQQVTILAHRQIMDTVGMQGNIELPPWGFEAVYLSLGERLRMTIPEVDKKETMDLPANALAARKLLWGQNVDDSPIMLQLNISPYTA